MSWSLMFRGWFGELKTAITAALFLSRSDYVLFNNITIRNHRGTTQIDHVIVSRFGVFVVETKNMRGWIFGDENSPIWTKVNRKSRLKFQNPLQQNEGHIRALSSLVGIPPEKMHSVVVFRGNSTLKTALPPNVLTGGYINYIKSKTQLLLSESDVKRVVATIREQMLPQTRTTRLQHVNHLKQRFESTTTCGRCGSPLVLRTARTSRNAGRQFLGCSRYPECRYVRKPE